MKIPHYNSVLPGLTQNPGRESAAEKLKQKPSLRKVWLPNDLFNFVPN